MGVLYGEDAGVDRNVPIDELSCLNRDDLAGKQLAKAIAFGSDLRRRH